MTPEEALTEAIVAAVVADTDVDDALVETLVRLRKERRAAAAKVVTVLAIAKPPKSDDGP